MTENERFRQAGARLKRLRTEHKLSRRVLSEKSGMAQSIIWKYESGGLPLSVMAALSFAPVLGTTASFLLFEL